MKNKIITAVLAATLCAAVAVSNFTLPVYASDIDDGDEIIIVTPPLLPDPDPDEGDSITIEPIFENLVASPYAIEMPTLFDDDLVADNFTIVNDDLVASGYTIETDGKEMNYEELVVSGFTITSDNEELIVPDYTIETADEILIVDGFTVETDEDGIALHLGEWGKEDIWEIIPDGECDHDSKETCSNCYKKVVIWEN